MPPKPRKRKVPQVPSIQPINRKGSKAGQAHADNVIGGRKPKPRPTDWNSYQRPEGFNQDKRGTWRLDEGFEKIGEGTGRKGEYGFNRLEGSQAEQAKEQAQQNYTRKTEKALKTYEQTGDVTKLLYFDTNTISPNRRRPRTVLAGYDGKSKTVRILFRHGEKGGKTDLGGAIYEYYGVPYNVWRMIKRNASTGRTINRVLNAYAYAVFRAPTNG